MEKFNFDDFKKLWQNCHINYLIGSGSSMPFLNTLKDVENALTELQKVQNSSQGIENDILTHIEVSIKHYYFKKCMERNYDLLEIRDIVTENLKKTLRNYKDFFTSNHTILTKRPNNIVSKQINIFTTNMDILMDFSIEKLNYVLNDGFFGRMKPKFGTENYHHIISKVSSHYEYKSTLPLFNLFKLHGSLNWKKVDDSIFYDSLLDSTKKLIDLNISDDYLIECFNSEGEFYELESICNNSKEILESLKCSNRYNEFIEEAKQFLEKYKELVIVNPNKDKFEVTSLNNTYYELLRMYSNNLEKENSILIVLGFSFADEHIRDITIRVADSNPSLLILVFAYDDDSEKGIKNNLGVRPNIIYVDRKNNQKYDIGTYNSCYLKKLSDELSYITKRTENDNLNQKESVSMEINNATE